MNSALVIDFVNTAGFDPDREDLPTTQGVVVFATLCILVFSLVIDTLYAWIDPRIRLT